MGKTTVVVDLSEWTPDMSFEKCIALCKELSLVDSVKHGDDEYVRVTQKGINVLITLMRLAGEATKSENWLKPS